MTLNNSSSSPSPTLLRPINLTTKHSSLSFYDYDYNESQPELSSVNPSNIDNASFNPNPNPNSNNNNFEVSRASIHEQDIIRYLVSSNVKMKAIGVSPLD